MQDKEIQKKQFLQILYDVFYVIQTKRYILFLFIIGFAVFAYLIGQIPEKKYEASAMLYPDETKPGLTLSYMFFDQFSPASGGGSIGRIIEPIVKSRTVSEQIVQHKVDFYIPGDTSDYLYDVICANLVPSYVAYKGFKSEKLMAQKGVERQTKIYIAARLISQNSRVETDPLGFIRIYSSWTDERLPGRVVNAMINEILDYSEKRRLEKAEKNLHYINARYDSIRGELENAEKDLGLWLDAHQNLVKEEARVEEINIERKVLLLQSLFASVVQQREDAIIALTRTAPIIKVLDPPLPPYKVYKPDVLLYTGTGIVMGCLVGITWLILYYYIIKKKRIPMPEKNIMVSA